MKYFTYAGEPLRIARYADIQRTMWPNRRYARLVQQVIHSIKPWKKREDPIETVEFDEPIYPMALPTEGTRVIWGVHRGHKAMKPGLSPFVDKDIPDKLMGLITVELAGTYDSPLLTRVYGGEYTPPLPWMRSVSETYGGVQESRRFWLSNAYLLRNETLIVPGTRRATPPDWFRG